MEYKLELELELGEHGKDPYGKGVGIGHIATDKIDARIAELKR